VSIADLPFRCVGGTPAAISLGPITPINEPIARRYGLRDGRDTHCTLSGPLAHTHAGRLVPASRPPSPPARKSNPHSARGKAGAKLPATSCLGAFRTPAARERGTLRHAGVRKPAHKLSSHLDCKPCCQLDFPFLEILLTFTRAPARSLLGRSSARSRRRVHNQARHCHPRCAPPSLS
jgi:hypothetical protein